MEAVIIDYKTAIILSEAHNDIGVQDSCSGIFFNFTDKTWSYCGSSHRHSLKHILDKEGIDGVDEMYIFIWVKNMDY